MVCLTAQAGNIVWSAITPSETARRIGHALSRLTGPFLAGAAHCKHPRDR